jgi:hypothetical protein
MNSLLPLDMKNELSHFVHKEKFGHVMTELLARTSYIRYYLKVFREILDDKNICVSAVNLGEWTWQYHDWKEKHHNMKGAASDVQRFRFDRKKKGIPNFTFYSHSLRRLREEMPFNMEDDL